MNPENAPMPPTNTYIPPTPPGPPSSSEQPGRWTAPKPRFLKNKKTLITVIVLLLLLAAVVAYGVVRSPHTDDYFDEALGNALSTANFTQYNTAGKSYLTIKYDVAAPSDSKVQNDGKLVQEGSDIAFNGYGDFKNSYMKFTTFTTGGKTAPAGALNKWFQVRKNGFDASGGYFAALFQNDPHASFFGDLIFGNFSPSDKAKLMSYIHQHDVYTVDKTHVQHLTYKGQAVAVYSITENKDALTGFNKYVGGLIKLSPVDVTRDIGNLQLAGAAKMYVLESTKRFVHLEIKSGTVDYYDYGTTKLGGAPTPQTTFEQFENLIVSQPPSNIQST